MPMSRLISNTFIHVYRGWTVTQHFYSNGTDNFSAFKNGKQIEDDNGNKIYANTPSEIDDIISSISDWGGYRPGAGAKKVAPPDATRRTFLLTDSEHAKVKEFISELRKDQV